MNRNESEVVSPIESEKEYRSGVRGVESDVIPPGYQESIGRKKRWSAFYVSDSTLPGNRHMAMCKYCRIETPGRPDRLEAHVQVCRAIPHARRQMYLHDVETEKRSFPIKRKRRATSDHAEVPPSLPTDNLSHHPDSSYSHSMELSLLLAEALMFSNLSMSFLEKNPFFRKFLSSLNSKFLNPTQNDFEREILPRIQVKSFVTMKDKIQKSQYYQLLIDSFLFPSNRKYFAISLCFEGGYHSFLELIEYQSNVSVVYQIFQTLKRLSIDSSRVISIRFASTWHLSLCDGKFQGVRSREKSFFGSFKNLTSCFNETNSPSGLFSSSSIHTMLLFCSDSIVSFVLHDMLKISGVVEFLKRGIQLFSFLATFPPAQSYFEEKGLIMDSALLLGQLTWSRLFRIHDFMYSSHSVILTLVNRLSSSDIFSGSHEMIAFFLNSRESYLAPLQTQWPIIAPVLRLVVLFGGSEALGDVRTVLQEGFEPSGSLDSTNNYGFDSENSVEYLPISSLFVEYLRVLVTLEDLRDRLLWREDALAILYRYLPCLEDPLYILSLFFTPPFKFIASSEKYNLQSMVVFALSLAKKWNYSKDDAILLREEIKLYGLNFSPYDQHSSHLQSSISSLSGTKISSSYCGPSIHPKNHLSCDLLRLSYDGINYWENLRKKDGLLFQSMPSYSSDSIHGVSQPNATTSSTTLQQDVRTTSHSSNQFYDRRSKEDDGIPFASKSSRERMAVLPSFALRVLRLLHESTSSGIGDEVYRWKNIYGPFFSSSATEFETQIESETFSTGQSSPLPSYCSLISCPQNLSSPSITKKVYDSNGEIYWTRGFFVERSSFDIDKQRNNHFSSDFHSDFHSGKTFSTPIPGNAGNDEKLRQSSNSFANDSLLSEGSILKANIQDSRCGLLCRRASLSLSMQFELWKKLNNAHKYRKNHSNEPNSVDPDTKENNSDMDRDRNGINLLNRNNDDTYESFHGINNKIGTSNGFFGPSSHYDGLDFTSDSPECPFGVDRSLSSSSTTINSKKPRMDGEWMPMLLHHGGDMEEDNSGSSGLDMDKVVGVNPQFISYSSASWLDNPVQALNDLLCCDYGTSTVESRIGEKLTNSNRFNNSNMSTNNKTSATMCNSANSGLNSTSNNGNNSINNTGHSLGNSIGTATSNINSISASPSVDRGFSDVATFLNMNMVRDTYRSFFIKMQENYPPNSPCSSDAYTISEFVVDDRDWDIGSLVE